MATQIEAQSSAGFTNKTKYRYDVFLSFRGEDTRHNFTVPLYNALRKKGIKAFIDDKKLGKGEEISPTLLKAIERSRISITVFSKNYATSTWCLEELAHIIWCKKEKNQMVMPIFYKVDPLDVQYQRNSFQEAMADLEARFRDDLGKVCKWRSALSEAASLSSAWLFHDGNPDKFIERIVEDAYAKLPRLHNTDHMVGLEPRIEEVMSLLDETDNGVCMLGIYGTGGIGKTTLAKALYDSIFYHFEGACFLHGVKEKSSKYRGIVGLQQTLVSEILEEKKMNFGSAGEGISRIKHRLSHKKVLLVLDDVDELEQLEQLAGGCDWFGRGSKIIITTRNKQLLIARNVKKTYEMKKLHEHYSLELLCWHAFGESQPPKEYKDMCIHVIRYARGLPLALKVIGSNLADKSIEEWRSIMKQYDEIPQRNNIHDVLKISYDGLQDGAKRIFLDIACFFKDEKLEFVEAILKACDDGATLYIAFLVDKSLIAINRNGYLYMHDLIQEMGRRIVREEASADLNKHSRIWYYKDALKVLQENLGSNNIEGIILDPPQEEEVKCSGLIFEKMNNLRILIVRNTRFLTSPEYLPNSLVLLDWQAYPSMNLPPGFSPKLVCLKINGSPFRLAEPFEKFKYLTYLDFSKCELITEVPDMSQFQNLKSLTFRQCHNLIKVHDSVGCLGNLVKLDIRECIKLKSFPQEIKLPSLKEFKLSDCKSLEYFPNIVGNMDSLEYVDAEGSAINLLPSSIGNLPKLRSLNLKSCKSLGEVPISLFSLQNLGVLQLEGLKPHGRKSLNKSMQESSQQVIARETNLDRLELQNCGLLDEDLHLTMKCFQNVRNLNLSGNDFVTLPECIKECVYLERLDMSGCKRLRDIPELPSVLQSIAADQCTSLTTESIGRLWSQAKEGYGVEIVTPAAPFPDWLDYCRKGDKLSFRVRGDFPRAVIAYETGKASTSELYGLEVFMRINGRNRMPWIRSDRDARERGRFVHSVGYECHVFFYDLLGDFSEQELKGLNKSLELNNWNDVEIQVVCEESSPDDISIVNCGVYVNKQETNMENVQFNESSDMISMNASTNSLKRRASASHDPDEPPKKHSKN